jgi:A1 cistron-splicing factor AAR2
MTRCGYWFWTEHPGSIRIKQWDRYNEVLGDPASQFEARDQKANIRSTYLQLIPHDYQGGGSEPTKPGGSGAAEKQVAEPGGRDQVWRELTSGVSSGFLDRVTGKKKMAEWLVDTSDTAKGELHFPETGKLFKSVVGSELNFVLAPDAVDLQLVTHPDRPADTSARIQGLLASGTVSEADMVGELQFVFLTGLHLGNYTCIEQWWHLVLKVILRAHQLVLACPTLCRALLRALHAQLVYSDRYISGGILDTLPQKKPRLRDALTVYKRRLNHALLPTSHPAPTPDQAAVGHAFVDLEAWFWKYGWDLRSDYVPDEHDEPRFDHLDDDSESGEYAPVVVELDDTGREVGLLRWD